MNAVDRSPINETRVELWRKLPLSTPLFLNIDPCTYCNQSCGFCPNSVMAAHGMMKTQVIENLIAGLKEFKEKIKVIRFCGFGEILLHPDIVRIFRLVRATNSAERIELITNGTMIDDRMAAAVPQFLDSIIISLTGLSTADYDGRIDFDLLRLRLATLFRNKGNCKIRIKTHTEVVCTAERLQRFHASFGDICDEIFVDNLVPQWPEFDAVPQKDNSRFHGQVLPHRICAQVFKGFLVLPDGRAVACCIDWKSANVIGNLMEASLVEIWNAAKLRRLQQAHLQGKKTELKFCQNCRANDYCDIDLLDGHEAEILKRVNEL